MNRWALVLLLATTLLPLAAQAQGTLERPITGGYADVYIVEGRIVDAFGQPVANATVDIQLSQKDVDAAPLRASTQCFGDFVAYFDLVHVDPTGTLTISVKGENGAPDATTTVGLDPYWRRTDVNLTYQGQWTRACADQTPLWGKRVTVSGRVLNETDAYTANDETFHARPYVGKLRLFWWPPNATAGECPTATNTANQGAGPNRTAAPGERLCDLQPVDARGDFKYSWVYPADVNASGHVQVEWLNATETKSFNFTVNETFREAIAYIDGNGFAAPGPHTRIEKASPAPDVGLLLATVGVAALGASLLAGKRRAR